MKHINENLIMKNFTLFSVFLVLVVMYENTFSTTEIELLRNAAENGEIAAQFQLGTAYYTGQGVPQDFQEAIKWYRKVAKKGFAAAQHNVGVAYSQGKGVPQNHKEAALWYRKAAKQGDSRSQNNLGSMYRIGKGVRQDYSEAVRWYRKAAEQGNAIAQYNLGVAYHLGHGVIQNNQEALKWYHKAAKQGHVQAQRELTKQQESVSSSPPTERSKTTKQMPSTLKKPVETLPKVQILPSTDKPVEILPKTQLPPTLNQPVELPIIQTPSSSEKPIETLPIIENQPRTESEKTSIQSSIPPETLLFKGTTVFALDKYRISLNYVRRIDKPFINQLTRYLREEGYTVDKIDRHTNMKIYKSRWDVRYYYDRNTAMLLKEHIQEFIQSTDMWQDNIKIKVRDFSFMLEQQNVRKGRIEVWILNPAKAPKLSLPSIWPR